MKIKFLTLILFLTQASVSVHAQQLSSLCGEPESKKARKIYDDVQAALKQHKSYDYIKELCEDGMMDDPLFAGFPKILGDAAWKHQDYKTGYEAYEKAIELCADLGPEPYFRLGKYYFDTKKYDDAVKSLNAYKEMGDTDSARNVKADQLLSRAKLIQNPVPFNPVRVLKISSPDPEYLPAISADQELFFFTRRFEEQSRGSITPKNVEKFMVAKRLENGTYESGKPMEFPFNKNTTGNEGASCISIDNLHLYFSVNDKGNFDLYESVMGQEGWSAFKSLGPAINHPKQWDSQPCISSDNNTIYFCTYRDSVNRTSDIYYSTKDAAGNWLAAKPLTGINTTGNEKSPFIHPDNKTLYFASDGYGGMGGYDLFVSKRDANGNWTKPLNLGYPINTEEDEVGYVVSTNGINAFYSAGSTHGSGFDIFSFELPPPARPENVLLLKGELKDENDQVPLNAKLELKNVQTKDVTVIDYDSISGKYAKVILFDNDYILTVKQKGFAFNSAYFSKKDPKVKEMRANDFVIKKIEINTAYELKNILFGVNSTILDSASKFIINDFAEFLKENPEVKVEIRGHTDNVGNAADNLKLSNGRAKAVYDQLITAGIGVNRLSYKGYGQTKPVTTNDTEEGKAQNRRTEFFIISK